MVTVNGEAVDPGMVDEAFNRIKAAAERRLQVSCCEKNDEFLAEAENEVIDSILIAQDADVRFPQIDEELVRPKLEELIKEYRKHGASWEMLEAQRDTMRSQITADLRMQAYMDDVLASVPEVSEEDINRVYKESQQDVAKPPRAKCQHICIFPGEHESVNAALAHANYLRKRAITEEDFEALAREFTEKDDKVIELDWLDLEDPLHPFEAILFSLEQNEVSPVISYDQAFHIIKVTGTEGAHVPALAEIRDEIQQIAERDRRRAALTARSKELREGAKIVRHEEPQPV